MKVYAIHGKRELAGFCGNPVQSVRIYTPYVSVPDLDKEVLFVEGLAYEHKATHTIIEHGPVFNVGFIEKIYGTSLSYVCQPLRDYALAKFIGKEVVSRGVTPYKCSDKFEIECAGELILRAKSMSVALNKRGAYGFVNLQLGTDLSNLKIFDERFEQNVIKIANREYVLPEPPTACVMNQLENKIFVDGQMALFREKLVYALGNHQQSIDLINIPPSKQGLLQDEISQLGYKILWTYAEDKNVYAARVLWGEEKIGYVPCKQ